MAASGPLTPARRGVLLAVLAVALLAAPLWAPALHLSEPTYRYERVSVTADENGIQYANESAGPLPPDMPISDEIACSGAREIRACAFEQLLLENETVQSTVTTRSLDAEKRWPAHRYRYVLLDDSVYEPRYVANRSAHQGNGWYRLDLTLEPADPDQVLQYVSLPAESDEVPATVAEAARTDAATRRGEIEVPTTPIRLEDGSYYRVYEADRDRDRPPLWHALDWGLRYAAPVVALGLFARLSRRIEYVGDDARAEKQRDDWSRYR